MTSAAAGPIAPWETPAVALPERITARWCAETLSTPAGDAVVRAHLEPARQDRSYRLAWERLWRMISFDQRWRRITTEMLLADRAQAVAALDGGATGRAAGRMRAYIHAVDRALERMEREAAGPLAWGSASYADYAPKAREVIEALALTVGEFLAGDADSADLAAVLDGLDLNPARRDVPPAARARAASHRRR